MLTRLVRFQALTKSSGLYNSTTLDHGRLTFFQLMSQKEFDECIFLGEFCLHGQSNAAEIFKIQSDDGSMLTDVSNFDTTNFINWLCAPFFFSRTQFLQLAFQIAFFCLLSINDDGMC